VISRSFVRSLARQRDIKPKCRSKLKKKREKERKKIKSRKGLTFFEEERSLNLAWSRMRMRERSAMEQGD